MEEKINTYLAQFIIKKGFSSASSLKEALTIYEEKKSRREKPDLLDILVEKNALTPFQASYIRKRLPNIKDLLAEIEEEDSSIIEGYEIISNIGSGGMGTVYKARQISMDRIVALKVLKEEFSNNKKYIERFLKEARAAGRLNHQNIVNVYDVGKSSGLYYIAMEFIDGQTLKERLLREKTLDIKTVLKIAIQICRALNHMEKNNIIHRDIKPDNIMITKDGVAKLSDLGIAKIEDSKDTTITGKKRIIGTAEYMSPEQARGKDVDHRTDIYSLGVTMYTLLAGSPPFRGEDHIEILKKVIAGEYVPLKKLRPDLPSIVIKLIEKAMAKEPENRFQTAQEMLEYLDFVRWKIEYVEEGEERIKEKFTKELFIYIIVLEFVIIIGLILYIIFG